MARARYGYVYILMNEARTVLYVGMTSDITRRLYEHRHHMLKGFTDKYNVADVLYIEKHDLVIDAIAREKEIKGWLHVKKIELIKKYNPQMVDIYDNVVGDINPFDYDNMEYNF